MTGVVLQWLKWFAIVHELIDWIPNGTGLIVRGVR